MNRGDFQLLFFTLQWGSTTCQIHNMHWILTVKSSVFALTPSVCVATNSKKRRDDSTNMWPKWLLTSVNQTVSSLLITFILCKIFNCMNRCFKFKPYGKNLILFDRGQHCIPSRASVSWVCGYFHCCEAGTHEPSSLMWITSIHPGIKSRPRKTNQSNQTTLLLECGFVTPTVVSHLFNRCCKYVNSTFYFIFLNILINL